MEKRIGNPNPYRCGAKRKYDGQPCQAVAMENGRCRLHGGRSTGPKDPSKLAANRNAVVSGEFESISRDQLDEDEQVLIEQIDTDPLAQLDESIRLLRIRQRRMLGRIRKLREEKHTLVHLQSETHIERGKSVEKVTERFEDNTERIQRIEDALTRVDRELSRILDLKHKFLTENGPIEVDVNLSLREYEEALNAIAGDVWADEEDQENQDLSE